MSIQSFLQAYPAIDTFEVLLPDLNGQLRGKWVPRNAIDKVFSGGMKLPLSTLAFDIWGRDPAATVFEQGDADGICLADSDTLAPVPWLERPTGQVLVSLQQADGRPCGYDPRSLLQGARQRLSGLGYTAVVAGEMEFYVFAKEQDALGRPKHTQAGIGGDTAIGGQTYGVEQMAASGGLMHAINDACVAQGVAVDTLISESAPSQYEINLHHQDNALRAADHMMMLKRVIKGVASRQGLRASFMAKPFGDLPGSGMHIHCSLLNRAGKNAFNHRVELLHQAIAGCLATLPDAMAIFASSLNAYRRFQAGSHAPVAPTWGQDNRTTALRIPADAPEAMRIEHRVAGADANPYLVVAAVLAGMAYGIENKLQPPAATQGDAYQQHPPSLPRYWPGALDRFEQSEFIRDYLGVEFQRLFSVAKRQELAEFDRQVTLLEYNAYL